MTNQNDRYRTDIPQDTSQSRNETSHNADSRNLGDSNYIPRPKRIACVVCRKRKLRCDGKKPSCSTCARLGHNCAYDEVRKKSGPKRGYVKQLEARLGMSCSRSNQIPSQDLVLLFSGNQNGSLMFLHVIFFFSFIAQVETLLRNQEPEIIRNPTSQQQSSAFTSSTSNDPVQAIPEFSPLSSNFENPAEPLGGTFGQPKHGEPILPSADLGFNDECSFEMISLGLEEPLPTQDVIDELYVRQSISRKPGF
jgi:hypothetical protein